MDRRAFMAATSTLAVAGNIRADAAPAAARFVGIQIAGHSFYDEGIERCLDTIQQTCRANALFVYSHSYYAAHNRPPSAYADHGIPIRDERKRTITRVWVRHHHKSFSNTPLRVIDPKEKDEYGDKDLFADLGKLCKQRGIKLFARILEPGQSQMHNRIENADTVLSIDIDGQLSEQPCRNHPDWKEFWRVLLCDVCESYPIDGFQWGAERVGPLSQLLWQGQKPFCFCTHCVKRGRNSGINVERAKAGFRELYQLITAVRGGAKPPTEGILNTIIQILYRHPEVLAWDYQWRLALEEQADLTYQSLKAVRKDLIVGRHLDHQNSSWDGLFRAQYSFIDMARSCDFIKPILYHDILGPRLRWWHLDRLKQGPLAELPMDSVLGFHYAMRGYDPDKEPSLVDLNQNGVTVHQV